MKQLRVIFTGGRDYQDESRVKEVLEGLSEDASKLGLELVIIHGKCPTGLDNIVDEMAREMGILVESYPADWKRYGLSAGPIRNEFMAKETNPNFVLAFPGGSGTSNMIKNAKKMKIPCRIIG